VTTADSGIGPTGWGAGNERRSATYAISHRFVKAGRASGDFADRVGLARARPGPRPECGTQAGGRGGVPHRGPAARRGPDASALSHPNIVAVIDLIETDGQLWLVEEWVDGLTVPAVLRRVGRLSPTQAVAAVRGGLLGPAPAGCVARNGRCSHRGRARRGRRCRGSGTALVARQQDPRPSVSGRQRRGPGRADQHGRHVNHP
jgi:hypothetical protein